VDDPTFGALHVSWGGFMFVLRTLGLFVLTAVAEIAGCYLPYLVLRKGHSAWLLLPAALSLAAFALLLTLHPTLPAGRTYAAYGGVYVAAALAWLWRVEGVTPDRWDVMGAAVALAGMAIIAFAPHGR
jgi:small multidrug resistance family-3 protein